VPWHYQLNLSLFLGDRRWFGLRQKVRIALSIILALITCGSQALEFNEARAKFNYQMSCSGCHAPDGSGSGSVPRMKDLVGHFLATEAGRDYLVRVPGSATSALADTELAEVLNWILVSMGGDSVDQDFAPYSASEVSTLRVKPLNEVVNYRAHLLQEIALQRSQQATTP
jgi:mono/diheme cytochrome c family protein